MKVTNDIVDATAEYVRRELRSAEAGHDWWHTERVTRRAREIQIAEGGDRELIELAALLHDLRDYKFEGGDTEVGPDASAAWLRSCGYPEDRVDRVRGIVAAVHFKGPRQEDRALSIEHAVVQDADRLDALGAIGVARAFSYGGHFGRPMLDPELAPDAGMDAEAYRNARGATVNHFFEKLFLLRDRMLTPTGARLARQAHDETHAFLTRFLSEFFGGEIPPSWKSLLSAHR